MAPIAVGDKIPDGVLAYFDEESKLQQVSVHSLAAGKKIILFGVPGGFHSHLEDADDLVPFFWGTTADDYLVLSDEPNVLKEGCGKSFAPFP